MIARAELDATIEKLEQSLVSEAAEDARARRIDNVIKELSARREKLYAKATDSRPFDGRALEAVTALDKKIDELRVAKAKVLSGEPDEIPPPPAPKEPARNIALPRDWPVHSGTDAKKNPLDGLEKLPADEVEFEKVYRQVREYGIAHINKMMLEFRDVPGGTLKATPTARASRSRSITY